MAIDQSGSQPLNAQVKADLVHRIRTGTYGIGDKIPSLRALASEYGVAELTVHAAVRELQHDGVLESASGRGTFVRALPGETDVNLAEAVDALRTELHELRERVAAIESARRSD
jgi:GntR family transcriptional regulator